MTPILLLLLSGVPTPLPDYVVQPGDTCEKLALRFYGNAREYRQLHAYNALGPPPHHLVPGSVLHLSAPSTPEARVTWLRPDVATRTKDTRTWAAAAKGAALYRRDEVNTRAQAAAILTFRDDSQLFLREQALVIVAGEPNRRVSTPTGVELVSGEARVSLSALRGRLQVATPASKVEASGKEVAVSVDAEKRSRISVHAGRADVVAMGKTVRVAEGQGTRVELGKPPEAPRPLPVAPTLRADTTVFVTTAESSEVAVSWNQGKDVTGFRLEAASVDSPESLFFETDVKTPSSTVRVPVGRSVLRVAATDASGLWSTRSAPLVVEVVRLAMLDSVSSEGVSVAPVAIDGAVTSLDGVKLNEAMMVTTPGPHELVVERAGGRSTLAFSVPARAPAPAPEPPPVAPTPIVMTLAAEPPPPPPEDPMASPAFLRDDGVGALSRVTPWQTKSLVDVTLQGDLAGRVPDATLTARHEHTFGARFALAGSATGRWTGSTPVLRLDLALMARLGLIEVGAFRLALAAQLGVLPLTNAADQPGTVRGQGVLTAGFDGDRWGAFLSAGADVNDRGPTVSLLSNGQVFRRFGDRWIGAVELVTQFPSLRGVDLRGGVLVRTRTDWGQWGLMLAVGGGSARPLTGTAGVQAWW